MHIELQSQHRISCKLAMVQSSFMGSATIFLFLLNLTSRQVRLQDSSALQAFDVMDRAQSETGTRWCVFSCCESLSNDKGDASNVPSMSINNLKSEESPAIQNEILSADQHKVHLSNMCALVSASSACVVHMHCSHEPVSEARRTLAVILQILTSN